MKKKEVVKVVVADAPKPEKKERLRRKTKREIDEMKPKVASLHQSGFSAVEIAKTLNISNDTSYSIIKSLTGDKSKLEHFISNKGNILEGMQEKIIETQLKLLNVPDEEINLIDANKRIHLFNQLSTSYGIYFDKHRLQTGQSTSNHTNLLMIVQDRIAGRVGQIKEAPTIPVDASEDEIIEV